MKDGCFLLFDPKTCMFENLPILSRKWNDTYYQLDTVEYKKNDRDKKYLDNLKNSWVYINPWRYVTPGILKGGMPL